MLLDLLEDLAAIAVLDIRFAASLDLPINRPPKFARGRHAVAKSRSPAARLETTVQEKIVRYRGAETGTRAMTRQSFVQASGVVRAPAELAPFRLRGLRSFNHRLTILHPPKDAESADCDNEQQNQRDDDEKDFDSG